MTDALSSPDVLAPARVIATPGLAAEHGLSPAEYQIVLERLGRAPNLVELGIFSVMWSEHCSYKSSRRHLRKLPTTGPRVIQGPGENAGVVDIGDGQAVIFKMESHNHPSFIEPYNGAATGVGGILRDVFTMGARPIALVNALRFGDPSHPKTRRLVAGVVAGIGGYGNCVGVPTVAGETNFHAGYNGNILVNAMAVGLADTDKIFYSRGARPGSPVLYVGSKTGRDGIHGATMASAEFTENAEERRPTVQVGDPFTEKLLIEACLELMATDAIEAVQDMGAAGLTSSSVEMADKGGVGIDFDLDAVPQREREMTAYEMMLSESQERMLFIMKPGREAEAMAIFEKWELDAAVIGVTTETGRMVLRHRGEVVCDIPVAPLADDAPNYDRPQTAPVAPPMIAASELLSPLSHTEALLALMACPDIASKRWIWEQYDRHVMADTIDSSQSGGDAALVRVHGTQKALAVTSDCTPRYVQADPFEGGKQAVAEAYRNLSAVGAEPIAFTDNLNFGNPERPEIMGQFVAAIEGMAEAARALEFPVVSGNVSLYNETNGVAIPPTPVVGGVGLITDLSARATLSGAEAGDVVVLLGGHGSWLGQSLYAHHLAKRSDGAPPRVDLKRERALGDVLRAAIKAGLVTATHDLSDGGLAVAITELALASSLGARVALASMQDNGEDGAAPFGEADMAALLFGEDQGRCLVTVRSSGGPADALGALRALGAAHGVPVTVLGVMTRHAVPARAPGEDMLLVAMLSETLEDDEDADSAGYLIAAPLSALRRAHEEWLPAFMAGGA